MRGRERCKWAQLPLREITQQFLNGGTPNTTVRQYWDGAIPWITGADAEQRTATTARKYITERGVRESATNIVPRGSILLVTRTGVGKVSVAGVDIAISQDVTGLVPNRELVDVAYLYHQLKHLGPRLQRMSQGTIIRGVQREEVEATQIPLPTLPEQRRIAEILDTADEAIRQTERVIAKLKAMKEGLLHDLLTRGLDARGQLRDPQAHPEQFKDSHLGRIPSQWECCGLSGFLREQDGIKPGPFGSSITKSTYTSQGYRVYGQEQVIAGDLSVGDYYISESKYWELQSFAVTEGDLLISLVGTIGRVLVVRSPFEPGIINPRLVRLRPSATHTDAAFLQQLMGSETVGDQLARMAQGGTMAVLSGVVLRRLSLAKPRLDEQRRIAEILGAQDDRTTAEEAELAQLRQVKRGLAADLLTGKVRVPGV